MKLPSKFKSWTEYYAFLEELDLIEKYAGQTVLIIDHQDPFQPVIDDNLFRGHGLDEFFDLTDPATDEQILSLLAPLGAEVVFIKPADDCEPFSPEQESENGV